MNEIKHERDFHYRGNNGDGKTNLDDNRDEREQYFPENLIQSCSLMITENKLYWSITEMNDFPLIFGHSSLRNRTGIGKKSVSHMLE